MCIHSIYKEQCLCFSVNCGFSYPDSRVLSRFSEAKVFKSKKKLYKFTYPFCYLALYFNLRVTKHILNHYGNSIDNSICPLEIGFSPLVIFYSHIILTLNLQSHNFTHFKRNAFFGS